MNSTDEDLSFFYEVYVPHWGDQDALSNIIRQTSHIEALFVDAVILSPLQEISERMKIGQLGSPYAVKDYKKLDPDLGTREDLLKLIDTLHNKGIRVLMDWFPATTAFDNELSEYSDSLTANEVLEDKHFFSFRDVALLDYKNEEVGEEMFSAMEFWVEEFGIDGFRIHYPGLVPISWLEEVRDMDDIILIAGEGSSVDTDVFDYYQRDTFFNAMLRASEMEDPSPIRQVIDWTEQTDGKGLYYTINYIRHSQVGSANTVFGSRYKMAFALTQFLNGQTLIYGGQEIPVFRGVSIYQNRDIVWPEKTEMDVYRQLILLKNKNKALHAQLDPVLTYLDTRNDKVLAIKKKYKGHEVIGIFNFSGEKETISFKEPIFNLNEYQMNRAIQIRADEDLDLAPMQFLIFTNI